MSYYNYNSGGRYPKTIALFPYLWTVSYGYYDTPPPDGTVPKLNWSYMSAYRLELYDSGESVWVKRWSL